MIDDNGDEWVTITDAARTLRVNPPTLYMWKSRGTIRGHTINRVAYINLTDARAAELAWRRRVTRARPD